MLRRSLSGLRLRLIALVLIAVIPALGLIVRDAWLEQEMAAHRSRDDALRLVWLASREHRQLIKGTKLFLIGLAHLPQVRERDPAVADLFKDLAKDQPYYHSVFAASPDGQVFASAWPSATYPSARNRSYFKRAVETRDFAIGDYQVSLVTGVPVVVLAYPAIDEMGVLQAVIAASLDLGWLNGFAAEADVPAGTTLTMVDKDGTILARYPTSGTWVGHNIRDSALGGMILAGDDGGGVIAPDVDGTERTFGLISLDISSRGADAYLAVGLPESSGHNAAREDLGRDLLAMGVVALLALTAAWFGGELFLLRRVRALLTATMRLSRGDLSARVGFEEGEGELGELAQAFDEMAGSLQQKQAETARAEMEARHQAANALALVQNAARLTAELDLQSVLRAVCEEAARALAVPIVRVNIYDEPRQEFHFAAGFGLPTGIAERLRPVHRSVHEELFEQTGSVAWVDDVRSVAGHPNADVDAELGLRSLFAARMLRDGEVVGVLVAHTLDVRHFDEKELALLKSLADQAAQAISNARLFEEARRGHEQQRALSLQLVEAHESERRQIARELHDEIGQLLTGLKLTLATAEELPEGPADSGIVQARELADELLSRVRDLSLDLRPSLLDHLGLLPTLLWYVDRYAARTRVKVTLAHDGVEGRRFPTSTETTAYRIVQEALTNVARHAGVSHAEVRVQGGRGTLQVQVEDRGTGFDPEKLSARSLSGGLAGMRERVRLLGGSFTIESWPGGGTRLAAELPIDMTSQEVVGS